MILQIFNFQLFKALDSTCSRLHQRVTPTRTIIIKSTGNCFPTFIEINVAGNLYLGPFEINERIR